MQALATLLMPIVRHGLTTAGGALIAHGYLDAGMQDTFIGFGLAGVGLALSFYKNLTAKK